MDNSIGKIYIKKRSFCEWLTAFVFFLPFFRATFLELLGIPDIISFLADVALVFIITNIIIVNKKLQIHRIFYPYVVLVCVFFVYVTITYLFNYQSFFYYFWGLRNYFRFYVAFIVYVVFLQWDDVERWFKILDWIYIINFLVIIVQFFMGFRQDNLGGIFGVQKGCNGMVLFFITVIIARYILLFMRNESSAFKCLSFSFIALFISAVAELKFFFVLFLLVAILSAVITKNSFKKILFLVLGALLVMVFSMVLVTLYESFSGFLSYENIWQALVNPNYATKEDIGRFTAIPAISNRFLTSWYDRLIGMGLGNADYSSVALFNTPFFVLHRDSHYMLMTYSFLYLETGILGLIQYATFFIISIVVSLKLYKTKLADSFACQLCFVFSIVCFALMVYNAELRTEIAYLAFFVLATPLISAKSRTE